MERPIPCLERAFELARTGRCLNVLDIIKCLKAEKYDISQVEGRALKKQLLQIIQTAVLNKQTNLHDHMGNVEAQGESAQPK
jgi:hypothetical protein